MMNEKEAKRITVIQELLDFTRISRKSCLVELKNRLIF